jgi:type III restriction enzyme
MPGKRTKAGSSHGALVAEVCTIRKTKGICGGRARIAGTRIPVWGIENARRMGLSVSEILKRYPSISRDGILAAWEYAAIHAAEIDREIRENQGS